jgi:hypothetical protein
VADKPLDLGALRVVVNDRVGALCCRLLIEVFSELDASAEGALAHTKGLKYVNFTDGQLLHAGGGPVISVMAAAVAGLEARAYDCVSEELINAAADAVGEHVLAAAFAQAAELPHRLDRFSSLHAALKLAVSAWLRANTQAVKECLLPAMQHANQSAALRLRKTFLLQQPASIASAKGERIALLGEVYSACESTTLAAADLLLYRLFSDPTSPLHTPRALLLALASPTVQPATAASLQAGTAALLTESVDVAATRAALNTSLERLHSAIAEINKLRRSAAPAAVATADPIVIDDT